MKILRETADDVKEMIQETKLLADQGYKGSDEVVPGIVVTNKSVEHQELRRRKVRIERFFGRLKCKFAILSGKFPLNDDFFDLVFDTCSSILNVELMRKPLKSGEEEIEQNHLKNFIVAENHRRQKVKAKNDKYRENQKKMISGTE